MISDGTAEAALLRAPGHQLPDIPTPPNDALESSRQSPSDALTIFGNILNPSRIERVGRRGDGQWGMRGERVRGVAKLKWASARRRKDRLDLEVRPLRPMVLDRLRSRPRPMARLSMKAATGMPCRPGRGGMARIRGRMEPIEGTLNPPLYGPAIGRRWRCAVFWISCRLMPNIRGRQQRSTVGRPFFFPTDPAPIALFRPGSYANVRVWRDLPGVPLPVSRHASNKERQDSIQRSSRQVLVRTRRSGAP